MISPAETDQTYFGLTPGLPPFHSAVELATSPASTDCGQLSAMYGQMGSCSLADFGSFFEDVIEGS